MKKATALAAILILLLVLPSCFMESRQEQVLGSIGNYDSKQFWTHGGFQDYTDFGIYTYSSLRMDKNQLFSPVSQGDMEVIGSFLDDYEEWIRVFRNNDPNDALVLHYAFDRSIIDTEDFFYIYEGENYPKYGCYDVWFLDSQTKTLYYFHNNI